MSLSTNMKGEIAELHVQLRATEKGAVISRPTTGARYDLVIDEGGGLKRVQVKYAGQDKGGHIRVALEKKSQSKSASARRYGADEIDILMIFAPVLNCILAFDSSVFGGKSAFYVRTEPSKNGQTKGTFWWEDFVW